MKSMKRILCLVLSLCLVLALVACGGSEQPGSATQSGSASASQDVSSGSSEQTGSASSEPAVDDGKVTYTITVVDEDGNPIPGAMVQICKDTCLPCGATNEDGVVTVTTVEDDYKVSFMTPVAGYVTDGLEFYFDEGSVEMLIILSAAE